MRKKSNEWRKRNIILKKILIYQLKNKLHKSKFIKNNENSIGNCILSVMVLYPSKEVLNLKEKDLITNKHNIYKKKFTFTIFEKNHSAMNYLNKIDKMLICMTESMIFFLLIPENNIDTDIVLDISSFAFQPEVLKIISNKSLINMIILIINRINLKTINDLELFHINIINDPDFNDILNLIHNNDTSKH